MSDKPQNDRRNKTQSILKKLLIERQNMLVLFCRLAGITHQWSQEKHGSLLDEFCQIMVDYIASGHFLLYRRIIEQQERRQEAARLAEKLYPTISSTTEIAVNFNDKYVNHTVETDFSNFQSDLSILGEHIAERIEEEDKLLNCLIATSQFPQSNSTQH